MIDIKRKERGSTLIEILIATAIFAFMMLGLAAAFSLIMKNNTAAKHQTDCATKAQQVAEVMETAFGINKESSSVPVGWPTVAVGSYLVDASDPFWNGIFKIADADFDIQYTLTDVAGGITQLDVTVSDVPTVLGGTKPKYPGARIKEARYTTYLK